jgi:hypothetical protein
MTDWVPVLIVALAFRGTGITKYWIGTAASVRLDVGSLDHLAPFFSFFGEQLRIIGGRTADHAAAQFRNPHLQLGVVQRIVARPNFWPLASRCAAISGSPRKRTINSRHG